MKFFTPVIFIMVMIGLKEKKNMGKGKSMAKPYRISRCFLNVSHIISLIS